ncbi:MAG: hypothetical protein WC683_01985 [bacterium]
MEENYARMTGTVAGYEVRVPGELLMHAGPHLAAACRATPATPAGKRRRR